MDACRVSISQRPYNTSLKNEQDAYKEPPSPWSLSEILVALGRDNLNPILNHNSICLAQEGNCPVVKTWIENSPARDSGIPPEAAFIFAMTLGILGIDIAES